MLAGHLGDHVPLVVIGLNLALVESYQRVLHKKKLTLLMFKQSDTLEQGNSSCLFLILYRIFVLLALESCYYCSRFAMHYQCIYLSICRSLVSALFFIGREIRYIGRPVDFAFA